MSRNDEEIITIEQFEFECTRSFELGIGCGYERAAEHIIERASKLFVLKQDSDAAKFRRLSEDLKEIGSALAEKARQKRIEGVQTHHTTAQSIPFSCDAEEEAYRESGC